MIEQYREGGDKNRYTNNRYQNGCYNTIATERFKLILKHFIHFFIAWWHFYSPLCVVKMIEKTEDGKDCDDKGNGYFHIFSKSFFRVFRNFFLYSNVNLVF